jgi:hypothetical protein
MAIALKGKVRGRPVKRNSSEKQKTKGNLGKGSEHIKGDKPKGTRENQRKLGTEGK